MSATSNTREQPRNRPSGRICSACDVRKTAHAFGSKLGVYDERCRLCVRNDVPAMGPRPAKNRRLCACCGTERGRHRFEVKDGVTAEVCDLCTENPDIRVTLRQQDAAAIVLRRLTQIATARLDAIAGRPNLGVLALQDLAQQALDAVEAAR